jgi:hypothetical protein
MLFPLFLAVVACINAAPATISEPPDFVTRKASPAIKNNEAIESDVPPSRTVSKDDLNSSEHFLTDEELNALTLFFGEPTFPEEEPDEDWRCEYPDTVLPINVESLEDPKPSDIFGDAIPLGYSFKESGMIFYLTPQITRLFWTLKCVRKFFRRSRRVLVRKGRRVLLPRA